MPEVNEGESRESYIQRCIPVVRGEGLDEQAALGKCEGMYDEHQKKSKAAHNAEERPIYLV